METTQGDEPTETIRGAARADFAGAPGPKSILILGLLSWMAFQWGFGNDVVLPTVASNVFAWADDGESWSSGVVAVFMAAAAGGGFWAVSQAVDAIVLLTGLKLVPNLTERISVSLTKRNLVKPYAELSWSTRWVVSYATGASVVCLVDAFATGRPGLAGRRRMIAETVVLSAGSITVVTGAVVAAAMIASRVPATEAAAEVFIRFARNPLTWITIFAIVFLVGALRDRRR